MNRINDKAIISKSGGGENSWITLLQWLRLLVLSMARIKVSLAGIFFHEPAVVSENHILLETTTTEDINKPKLTGMKFANRYIRLSIAVLFTLFTTFAAAQSGPFPFTGNDTVCLNVTKSYGVTAVAGSTYSWTLTPGTQGIDWIL